MRGAEAALLAPTAVNQQKFVFALYDDNRVEAKAKFSPISYGYAKFDKTVSGAWTEFGYFTTNSGISEQTLSVSVTPNPASDELNIHHVAGAQISIYCLNGQEMKRIEKADMNEVINISGWSAGVYVVRCTFEGYVSMVKFVKE